MATRTRIIEGTWGCSSCDAREILGRHKVCPNCGNPRESGAETQFDFGSTDASGRSAREAVADEKAAELGSLGADWYCPYCAAGNRDDAGKCHHCSAPKPADPPREKPVLPPPAAPASPPAPGRRRRWIVLGVVLAFFGSCGVMCTGFDKPAKVLAMHWERTLERQTFEPAVAQGWRSELAERPAVMPVNGAGEVAGVANVRDCESRQHGTRQVPDGTEHYCETKSRRVACGSEERCTRRDKGNGFAEETCHDVTKYCSESYESCGERTRYRTEPVYEPFCRYDTWAWVTKETSPTSGDDAEPRWAALEAGARDRLLRREKYRVEFGWGDDGGRRHIAEPENEAAFTRFRPGQRATLSVNALRMVLDERPAP